MRNHRSWLRQHFLPHGGHDRVQYVLVGKLEVLLPFSRSEVLIFRPGVMFGLNVSTAVDFNLGGNTIHAGFTTAASPLVVSPRATSGPVLRSSSTSTMDGGHATPVPGGGSISGLGCGTGVGKEKKPP
jgi:hypothetical protein